MFPFKITVSKTGEPIEVYWSHRRRALYELRYVTLHERVTIYIVWLADSAAELSNFDGSLLEHSHQSTAVGLFWSPRIQRNVRNNIYR